jgi:hypothetical protein
MSSEPKNYAGVQWGLGRPSVILVGRYEPLPADWCCPASAGN